MNIEDYIRKNRNQLDVEKVDEEYLWTGISQTVNKKVNQSRFLFVKIAATIIVLIALSFITYQITSLRSNQQLILAKIDPDLAKQEAQFQNQIKTYYQVLQKTNYDEELLSTSFNDLEYIDTLISKYSDDLSTNGPNPKLLNSLMDLYQKKIRLLDRMLNEIEKNQHYENDKTNI
ncbi:MAG: hypothetical protein PF485_11090 [Bacteroidales bacterium]|jgi:hypothetical protein|nr:hypothetical protein [Bacteroidales bacterium]